MLHTGAEHLYYALRSFSQGAYTAKPVWNSPPAITEYRQNTTPKITTNFQHVTPRSEGSISFSVSEASLQTS